MELVHDFFEAAFPWLALGFVLAVALASLSKGESD